MCVEINIYLPVHLAIYLFIFEQDPHLPLPSCDHATKALLIILQSQS